MLFRSMELIEKLGRLQWLVRKRRIQDSVTGGPMADPTRGQGRILALLKLQDGVSTRDLSFLLGIRVSSLNELLAKLEKSGHICREPAEADKRVILVKLTEMGREAPQAAPDIGDVFSCLTYEEMETFGEYLDRIIASLESKGADDGEEAERGWWIREARDRMGDEMFDRLSGAVRGFQHGLGHGKGHGRGCSGGQHHGDVHSHGQKPCCEGPYQADE